jgi:hypothetical protein
MTHHRATDGTLLWRSGFWACGPILYDGSSFQAAINATLAVELVDLHILRMMRG